MVRTLLTLSLICSVAWGAAPAAEAISYDERTAQDFLKQLEFCDVLAAKKIRPPRDGCFVKIPKKFWDGKKFTMTNRVQFMEANKYVQGYKAAISSVVWKWNGRKSLQKHAKAREMLAKLKAHQAYFKALVGPYQACAKLIDANEKKCKAFRAKVANRKNKQGINQLLYGEEKGYTGLDRNFVKQIADARRVGDAVAAECKLPQYATLGKEYCTGASRSSRLIDKTKGLDNAAVWCKAAAKRDKVLQKVVGGFVKKQLEKVPLPFYASKGSSAVWMRSFRKDLRRGLQPFYLKQLVLTPAEQNKLLDRFKSYYQAAKIDFKPSPNFFDGVKKRFVDARANIEKAALSVGKPNKGKALKYALKLAKQALKRKYPKAKLKKIGMYKSGWEIRKNSIGIPKWRKRSGWMIYKVPGEKWCRRGQWGVWEQYAGGGRYQKDDIVKYVNPEVFMKCK